MHQVGTIRNQEVSVLDARSWIADVLLADGGVVRLRPAQIADRDSLRAMYGRLSSHTIEMRFFGPATHLLEIDIDRVVTSDGHSRVALLATLGEYVVAVAYYQRSSKDPSTAEIAFIVEDAQQHRGMASIILEHLASIARDQGIEHMIAEIRPDNKAMISVFRQIGFAVNTRLDDSEIHATIDLADTERSLEVARAREHASEARSVARLLNPGSIAVIGASRQPGSIGNEIFRHLLDSSFEGPTFPVNPAARHIAGVHAYPSVVDVPGIIDVAFVALPAERVFEIIPDCASKGIHCLVLFSSFSETEGGRERQERAVQLARAYGMRIVGPECMGIINTDPAVSLNGTLVDTFPMRGRVGFFAQSGALSADILARAMLRGIGVSTLVSAGARADVSVNDLLQYWLNDDATDCVLLYLETIGNPKKFARLARSVSRRKPLILVQAVSPQDRSRSLAMFRQAGVLRVDSLSESLDVAALISTGRLPRGNRVAIIDNTTSIGAIAAAACEVHGLAVIGLQHLGAAAPIDEFRSALAEVLANPEVDSVVTTFLTPVGDRGEAGRVIEELSALTEKPVLVITAGELPSGVPAYSSPEDAVRALGHVAAYVEWLSLPTGGVPSLDRIDRSTASAALSAAERSGESELSEHILVDVLDAYGLGLRPDSAAPEIRVVARVADDDLFGRVLSFGLDGIYSELFGDISWRALPMTDEDAARMIDDIDSAPLLFGYNDGPVADRDALEEFLIRMSRVGFDHPRLASLEVVAGCSEYGVHTISAEGRIADPQHLDDAPRRML